VKFVQKVHITPATIQLKKEPLLHGAARHVATMLDQVVLAQRATVPHARQDAMMPEHQDVMTQAAAVLVLPDPKVGAPKVTDQHVHHDETMLARQDAMMIDQVVHDVMIDRVVHAPKVTDQHVHHDATTDQADHDVMIDRVVHAPKVTDQHVHHDEMMLAHHDAMMLVHHDATTDQADHVRVVHAPKVTDQHVHHDATMHVRRDETMLDQVVHDQVVRAPKVTDQVASGRVDLVLQVIAPHAEDQRVHVVIPTSLRVLKQQKNVNR